jgi:hypothetical protein
MNSEAPVTEFADIVSGSLLLDLRRTDPIILKQFNSLPEQYDNNQSQSSARVRSAPPSILTHWRAWFF